MKQPLLLKSMVEVYTHPDAEDDTDVSADATLRAGEAERGFEVADAPDAVEPDADLEDWGGKKPRHPGTWEMLSKRGW